MKKQTITVKDVCQGTFTNAGGVALYYAIVRALDVSDVVVLSFDEITAVSSSFLNSSIGNIIDERGIDVLKSRVKITHYTPTLAAAIKKYIVSYSSLAV